MKKADALGSSYRKLLISNCINRFGDSIDTIALTWLVYTVTGSAFWSAVYYACNQLPTVIIQPFAGAVVEIKSKRKIMMLADMMRGAAVLIMTILYNCNMIHPLITIIFTLFISTVESFRVPAGNALIANVVTDCQYEEAISKNTSFTTIASLLGTAVAGLVISLLGTTCAMAIDILTFFLSSVLLAFVNSEEVGSQEKNAFEWGEKIRNYINLFWDGINYVKESLVITKLILLVILFNGMLSPINSLIAPLISEYYNLGSVTLSVFSIALSLGMAIAGFTFIPLADKVKSPQLMLSIGAVILGGIYLLLIVIKNISFNDYLLVFMIALGGLGIGYIVSANMTMLTVNFMRTVAKTHIARIAALYNSVASISIPVFAFILGMVTEYVSVATVFVISGIFCIATSVILHLFIRNMKHVDLGI